MITASIGIIASTQVNASGAVTVATAVIGDTFVVS